jgi:hypothetical protein
MFECSAAVGMVLRGGSGRQLPFGLLAGTSPVRGRPALGDDPAFTGQIAAFIDERVGIQVHGLLLIWLAARCIRAFGGGLRAVFGKKDVADGWDHASILASLAPDVNPLFVSIH